MHISAGIDIGTGAVKAVLFKSEGGENPEWLGKRVERIRRREPMDLARLCHDELLAEASLTEDDIGEGENIEFRTGHFYSMTTHARGAIYLDPDTRAAMDVGALHGRAIRVDDRGKVLTYKMTSQCASGSGQFLENIARYLGVALDEVGDLSQQADDPEAVSSICAVLAETDVINMVSRGISTQNILKGIHTSMADRLVKLLKSTKVGEGTVLVTGGLANDSGLVATMAERMVAQKMTDLDLRAHPDSIYAGAIGAALWGAFRHQKLVGLEALPKAS